MANLLSTIITGGSGTTPTLALDRNIATPSNYYNGLQLEVRATSGTAGIALHRNGYSHVGIYHDSSNELKFNMNAGTPILPATAGTIWGSGNDGTGSGLDADMVDGYHVQVSAGANTIPTRNSSGYLIPENWIQLNGIYGLYSPTNNAHLRPNPNSYGSWLVTGGRNGWGGIEFDYGNAGNISLMISGNSNESGFHNNSYGWQILWSAGTLYVGKGTYGGTNATVWDSSNAPRANYGNLMYYQGFTLNANTMDSNSTGFTYANNAPFYGPIARFSTGGGYDLWLGGSYNGGGNAFYLRTRDGDAATLNPWREIITSGNIGSQSVSYATTAGTATSAGSASVATSAGSVDGLTINNSGNPINPDNVTQNQIGYNTSVSLYGQSDGGLYSSAYSSSWIHQIYGDFRTGQVAIRGKNAGTWQDWRYVLDDKNIGSYAVPYGNMTSSTGLNDNKLYLRTNGDNNHYLWNAADDWEELVYYTGTGFRVKGSTGVVSATFTDSGLGLTGGITTTATSGSVLFKHAVYEADAWIFQENAANWGLYWKNNSAGNHSFGSYTTVGAELVGMSAINASGNAVQTSNFTGATSAYGTWLLSNYNGYIWSSSTIQAASDMRAPIFYDSNNTGYYGDFASTSVMNAIRFGTSTNNATLYGNDDWGVRLNTDSGWIQFGPANSSWAHIYSNLPFYFNQDLYVNGTRVVLNSGTWGINITGNSNTTSQVVFSDLKGNFPSGAGGGYSFGSNHYSMGLDAGDGGWNHPHYRDLIIGYHTGIRIGANYSGIRFYNNSPTTDANNDGNGDGGEALLMTIGGYVGTANHTDVVVNNNLFANVSMRAPIFYDSNDTAFYVDPNSSSRLRNLYVGDSGSNWSDPGGWGTQFHVSNGPHSIIRVYARNEGIETGMFSHIGGQSKVGSFTNHDFSIVRNFNDRMIFYSGYTYANGYLQAADSLRAPIFYDSNDTGYYLDPNSESNLWRFTAASMTRNAMNYLSINSPYVTRSQQAVGHLNGIMGWGSTDLNTVFSNWGSGFFDSWGWPGQRPNDSASHWVGLQSMHYNHQNGTNGYGWQMVNGGNTNRWYLRQGWPDVGSWQEIITSGNIGSQSVNYATSAGSSSSSSRSSALDIVGYGNGNMTYYQSSGTFAGQSGWAGYFISNHGDGATYYNQTIIMPFWGAPQYSRLQGGTFVGPYTFWTTENLNDYAPNMNQYVRTSDNVTFNTTTAPTILVNNHSDNTKGYRIHNTSGSSVSAMFTNSSNQLVIAAGAVDQINLNKKVYVNGVALGVNVSPSATAGRIDASNDIVAYSSSDERLKYNITPIENAIDKVKSLTGVEFDWKPEYKHAHGYEGHDTGIIAQQVQEVIPSAVRTNDTGFLAVRYEKLIGLLVEGMKEQQAQIEELKAKLDGLTK